MRQHTPEQGTRAANVREARGTLRIETTQALRLLFIARTERKAIQNALDLSSRTKIAKRANTTNKDKGKEEYYDVSHM